MYFFTTWYRSGFLKKDWNHSPKSFQKIWRTYCLGTNAWLGSFLTSIGSSGFVQTLWMSEMTPSKALFLNPFVLQIFLCVVGEWFWSFLREPDLYVHLVPKCHKKVIIGRLKDWMGMLVTFLGGSFGAIKYAYYTAGRMLDWSVRGQMFGLLQINKITVKMLFS